MKRTLALLAGLAGLAERIGTALQWLSPVVARLTVGLVFLQSGWGKLHDLEKVTNYFTQLGLAAPAFQARLASTAEFVCGGLLLVGLTEFAYIALLVWLGTNGAGPLSLDRLVARGWHGGAERAAAVAPSRATT